MMSDDGRNHATGIGAWIKRARRTGRALVNRLLACLLGTVEPRRRPLAADTRRLLVVRLNKRLGNILFLTPMLRTLAESLPTATIDIVIQDARQKPLLETLPGIGQVWVQERSLLASAGLLRRLRAQRYDLAIDPSGNSTGNRLTVALSGARQRMGFASHDRWLKLTHAAARPDIRHQALQAVKLLEASVTGTDWQTFDSLAVFPDDAAHRAADRYWVDAFEPAVGAAPVVAFFTQATDTKQLDTAWWTDFRHRFADQFPQARLLQICPPGTPAPARARTDRVSIAELDVLAALLGRVDAFIAADSGPMHLAAAAGVPVVGLFQATGPEYYAPLGRDCVCLSNDDLTPARAVAALEAILVNTKTTGAAGARFRPAPGRIAVEPASHKTATGPKLAD